jgi:two-component system, NtrC family, sensor kinase
MTHSQVLNQSRVDHKRTVPVLAGIFLPLLFLGAVILVYLTAEKTLRQEQQECQRELGRALASSLDSTIAQSGAVLMLIARTTPFEQLQDPLHLGRVLLLLRKDHGRIFRDLGLVDETGRQVSYAGPFDLQEIDYGQAPWFDAAIDSEVHISGLLPGQRQRPHFVLAARFQQEGRGWLLKTSFDLEEVHHILASLPLPPGSSVVIIDQEGRTQALSDRSRPLEKETAALLAASLNGLDQDQQVLQSDSGLSFVMTPMTHGGWGLVLQRDLSAISPDHRTLLYLSLLAAAVGTVLIVATLVLICRCLKTIRSSEDSATMQVMNEQFIEAGKMASIGELAAGIAHEINNPIATMVEEAGWMEDLLQEDEELAKTKNYQELRRSLSQIKTQGARCKDITHKMLSFARKSDLRIQDIHLNNLIREVASLSDKRARYANTNIVLDLDPEVPLVAASATEMQQVILNLLNNALDAMEKTGGTITITTRKVYEMVEVHVADTGEGIPKGNLARIFDPFYTTKPAGKGTGLGLSICYTIIKNMGGDISVSSQVGVGTTFTLRLPIGRAPEPRNTPKNQAITP